MKTKMLSLIFSSVIALLLIVGCGSKSSENSGDSSTTANVATGNSPKPLNISIYLDLSDRLVRNMKPVQKDRDIEIVKHITEIVKNHAVNQKILPCRDRIKVFFYPSPNDSEIASLANDLEMDLDKAKPAEKKKLLMELQDKFSKSLTPIYDITLQNKNWIGSDIWGFFKKQVDTYCVKKDARNIIVILTDGYIFHENNQQKDGNNFSYILPKTLANKNSGLIISRKGLENLEVLMLEVNPYTPTQEAQMEDVLKNWFFGMGVKKLRIGETDLPTNTKMIIDEFFGN